MPVLKLVSGNIIIFPGSSLKIIGLGYFVVTLDIKSHYRIIVVDDPTTKHRFVSRRLMYRVVEVAPESTLGTFRQIDR